MIQPYIIKQDSAVFVVDGSGMVENILDGQGIWDVGSLVSSLIFQEGIASEHKLVIKPNLTVGHVLGRKPPFLVRQFGVTTDVNFVGGFIASLIERKAVDSPHRILVAEKNRHVFSELGYLRVLNALGARSVYFDEPPLIPGNTIEIDEGVVMRQVALAKPAGNPGSVLVNIGTFKSHNTGVVTGVVKNIQGLAPCTLNGDLRGLCRSFDGVRRLAIDVPEMLVPNAVEKLEELLARHRDEGYHDMLDGGWTERDEAWSQRICDMVLAARPAINIAPALPARGGSGFQRGEDKLPAKRMVVFGSNPFHVDAVVLRLMGHDPWLVGVQRIARERGLALEPDKIPTFAVDQEGGVKECLDVTERFGCLNLPVLHHTQEGGEELFIR